MLFYTHFILLFRCRISVYFIIKLTVKNYKNVLNIINEVINKLIYKHWINKSCTIIIILNMHL